MFGLVLLNDWSARDIQRWEYIPLGPFNGKNFLTTVSPWVVTLEALEPFKCEAPRQDPPVLEYLADEGVRWSYDLELTASLATAESAAGDEGVLLSRSNLRGLYWTPAQMVAHHTAGGCNLRPGDLLGTGERGIRVHSL